MPWIAGVDGCHGGWFVVMAELTGDQVASRIHQICPSFQDVLNLEPEPKVVCIDVPIGLLDEPRAGGRVCDVEARSRLPGRTSSVFSPPTRPQCEASTFGQARTLGPMTMQTFAICSKIHEVDRLMTPELQRRVFEVHPELSFCGLSGGPMRHRKKSREGLAERQAVLSPHFTDIAVVLDAQRRRGVVEADDILDAYAALSTARQIVQNRARRIPDSPPVDSKRLRMEMWW